MLPIECEGWYEDEDSVAMAVWWAPENELVECLKTLIEEVHDPLANAYLRGMLLLRVLDPDDVRVPDIEARVSETASRVAVHRLGRVEIFDSTLRGDMCTRLGCAVSHGRLHGEPRRDSIMHWVPQNTECEAWRKLVAYIEQVRTERRATFTLSDALGFEEKMEITTLPPSIGTLTHLQEINLYGTNLSRLPPELGNLTELKTFSAFVTRQARELIITQLHILRAALVPIRAGSLPEAHRQQGEYARILRQPQEPIRVSTTPPRKISLGIARPCHLVAAWSAC